MNKLIVNKDILITFFWKDSFTKNLIKKIKLNLISPEYSLEEIRKNQEEILRKCKISKSEFDKLREELASYITFTPLETYKDFI